MAYLCCNRLREEHLQFEDHLSDTDRVNPDEPKRNELEKAIDQDNVLSDTDRVNPDEPKRNELEKAIDQDNVEKVLEILNADGDDWGKYMRVSRNDDTPMRKLIKNMPAAANLVLNKCTQIKRIEGKFTVVFDYTYLDDTYLLNNWRDKEPEGIIGEAYTSDRNPIKKNHTLMIMVTSKRTELLDHPLVSAFLKRKWMSIGLIFSILNLLIYAVFLALLTGFSLAIRAPYKVENILVYNNSECQNLNGSLKNSECLQDINATNNDSECRHISGFASFAQIGVYFFAIIELLIEILEIKQMYWPKLWKYFKKMENLSEWITCLAAMIFVSSTSDCDTGFRPEWQWTFGSISVLLAWVNLLLLLQKFEWIGIYVVMLYRLVKMFMKFFLVFSLLIVAFAISFYCLVRNQEQFRNVGISLVKTTSMMIGDTDFGTIFFDETVHFDFISYVFFYIFMLFMTILVINLLVGLTVDNIQEFKKEAGLAKKRMQVDYALELERLSTSTVFVKCFGWLLEKCCSERNKGYNIDCSETFIPKNQSWLQRKISESWKLTERDIDAGLNKKTTSRDIAQLDKKITKLENYIKSKLEEKETTSRDIAQPETSRDIAQLDKKCNKDEKYIKSKLERGAIKINISDA